jgi:hypothetical protein
MLPKIPKPAEVVRSTFRLPTDLVEQLNLYTEAYNELNCDTVTIDEVLVALLQRWMAKDRDFQRWRKRRVLTRTKQQVNSVFTKLDLGPHPVAEAVAAPS